MSKGEERLTLVLLAGFILWVFLGLVPKMIEQEKSIEAAADVELKHYCEMVDIRRNSGDPYLGWPDYRGVYDSECN